MLGQHPHNCMAVGFAGRPHLNRRDNAGATTVNSEVGLMSQHCRLTRLSEHLRLGIYRTHTEFIGDRPRLSGRRSSIGRAPTFLLNAWRRLSLFNFVSQFIVDRPKVGYVAFRQSQLLLEQITRAHTIGGGVGLAQGGVHEKHIPLDEATLSTQPDNAPEETFIYHRAEAPPRLAEHAVIGNGLVQLVAQKPAPGQVELCLLA